MAHYYLDNKRWVPVKKDGTPYQRITKKMAMDAGAVMGVTDILKAVSGAHWMKDYFTNLGIEAAASANAEFMQREPYPELYNDWRAFAEQEAKRMQDKPADQGALIHDAINDYLFNGKRPDNAVCVAACESVEEYLERMFPDWHKVASGEHCFTANVTSKLGTPMRYGGTYDFRVPGVVMLDFKTCEEGRKTYATEAAQLAAYLHGVDANEQAFNIYINRTSGEIQFTKMWTPLEIELGWEMFCIAYRFTEMMDEYAELQKGTNA